MRGTNRRDQDRGAWGTASQLPSGNWRGMYWHDGRRHTAPHTFKTKTEARAWLATERSRVIGGTWQAADAPAKSKPELTLADYAEQWMRHKKADLTPKTAAQYRSILDRAILPKLGALPVDGITVDDVKAWYAKTATGKPTWRAQSYSLLRNILGDAVREGKLLAQPCQIKGAGSVKRARHIKPAENGELAKLIDAMPKQYRAMVVLAAWCAMRFGELTELRRSDVDAKRGVIHIRRGVTHTGGKFIVGPPKTAAGSRDVNIPSNVLEVVRAHLIDHTGPDGDALLFPAMGVDKTQHLAYATFHRHYDKARNAIGRGTGSPFPLNFHAMRHTGAVMAAQAGATLADLMGRLGHTTPQAAMIYQSTSAERDRKLAERMAELAASGGFA